MRKYLFLITILVSCNKLFSQKRFDLTIVLNDNIDPKNITCRYYNGETDILIKDTFVNKTLVLKENFYSSFVSFHFEYRLSSTNYYTNDFFVNEKPAKIVLQLKSKEQNGWLGYKSIFNALPIYDTSANKIFKQLVHYRRKEALAVSDFWQKHGGELGENDSLAHLNRKLFKSLNIRTISFLKNYPKNYFSFWYFRTQVVEPSLTFLTKDLTYLKYLLSSMKSIYSNSYIKSAEGQRTVNKLSGLINPPRINSPAPLFNVKDIDGNSIRLSDYKGKYILLDFWASWCLPCIREIPFIKKIRIDNSAEKLVIIGVSDDRNVTDLKQSILKNDINWINVLDDKKQFQNHFGVIAIPVTILINKEGIIIYDSREIDDKVKLLNLLNNYR